MHCYTSARPRVLPFSPHSRYAAESFPGITQALSDGDLSLAQDQVRVAAACVSDAAAFLSGEQEQQEQEQEGEEEGGGEA